MILWNHIFVKLMIVAKATNFVYIFDSNKITLFFNSILQILNRRTCLHDLTILFITRKFSATNAKNLPSRHNCDDSMRNSVCCSMHFFHFRSVMTFHKVRSSGSNGHDGDEAWSWNAAAVQCNCIENKPRCIGASGAYNRYV